MNCAIVDIAYYLPDKVTDNAYLSETCGIDPLFLENKVGIRERHVAADDESTSDMAVKAAKALFACGAATPEDIDLLILCTQNPDYRLPSTACIVQHKLGLSTACAAFDINQGCSGFVYSLAIAAGFMETGMAKKPLLLMADQYSRIVDPRDRNTVALFGDAASAILVEPCKSEVGLQDMLFGTNGGGADLLICHNSGVVRDIKKAACLYMDGRAIFKFSITDVVQTVSQLLDRNSLSTKNIRYFIFHQANRYILDAIRKQLGLDEEQMIIDMALYGNTVSSTIPIAMKNLIDKKALHTGDQIVLCGFGVGLSWAVALYQWL